MVIINDLASGVPSSSSPPTDLGAEALNYIGFSFSHSNLLGFCSYVMDLLCVLCVFVVVCFWVKSSDFRIPYSEIQTISQQVSSFYCTSS